MQRIKISVLDIDKDDDNFTKFQINITNKISSSYLEFYGYLDTFKEFASGLMSFPKTIKDDVVYEVGEDTDRWAYYMLLKVYCFEINGNSAIHIKIDDHHKAPYTNKTEFYILTVPASINKLGQLLDNWNPEIEKELIWIAD